MMRETQNTPNKTMKDGYTITSFEHKLEKGNTQTTGDTRLHHHTGQ